MDAIRCCLAWDKNSKASIDRTRGIGDKLSGESSSDVDEEELLLANFAALFPFNRFGLYGLNDICGKNGQVLDPFEFMNGFI